MKGTEAINPDIRARGGAGEWLAKDAGVLVECNIHCSPEVFFFACCSETDSRKEKPQNLSVALQ